MSKKIKHNGKWYEHKGPEMDSQGRTWIMAKECAPPEPALSDHDRLLQWADENDAEFVLNAGGGGVAELMYGAPWDAWEYLEIVDEELGECPGIAFVRRDWLDAPMTSVHRGQCPGIGNIPVCIGPLVDGKICRTCGDTTGKPHCCAVDPDGTKNGHECECKRCKVTTFRVVSKRSGKYGTCNSYFDRFVIDWDGGGSMSTAELSIHGIEKYKGDTPQLPDAGDGYALCEREEASDFCRRGADGYWLNWSPIESLHEIGPEDDYAYRKREVPNEARYALWRDKAGVMCVHTGDYCTEATHVPCTTDQDGREFSHWEKNRLRFTTDLPYITREQQPALWADTAVYVMPKKEVQG